MPLIINRRGGARLPNRRIPVVPPFPQPDRQEQPPSKAPVPEADAEAEAEASGSTNAENGNEGDFEPGPKDVRDVKLILLETGNLPPEVADIIIDYAEYWACNTTIAEYRSMPGGHLTIYGAREREDRFLVRTEPIGLSHWSPASYELWRREATPRLLGPAAEADVEYPKAVLEALAEEPVPDFEHPVRKIVFDIVSRDQGWSGDPASRGTYRNSYTWFDAGLDRFDRTITCPEDCPDRKNPLYFEHNILTCAIRPIWPPSVPGDERPSPPSPESAPEAPAAETAAQVPPPAANYQHDLHATPDHCIQHNKLAVRAPTHHRVEWRADDDIADPKSSAAEELAAAGRGRATGNGEFVRGLKLGDMVTVWGRARFPGWSNNVERVEVKVFWAV